METMNQKSVLVVRIPENDTNRLRELRDFLLQSGEKGLLVIPEDTVLEVMDQRGAEPEPTGRSHGL